jgi:hypothetical protein
MGGRLSNKDDHAESLLVHQNARRCQLSFMIYW